MTISASVHRIGTRVSLLSLVQSTMRRSVMNTLPQLNENGHLESPESASPPHPVHARKYSMNGTLPGVAEDSRLGTQPGMLLAY